MLPAEAADIDARRYPTEVSTVALNATAIARLVEASRAAQAVDHGARPIQALLERRLADGHGAESLAGLTELIRQPN